MSKWMEKMRKRREERQDKERQKIVEERRAMEEAERKRRQLELQNRAYEQMVKKKLDDKKREADNQDLNLLRHQQLEEAQRIRQEFERSTMDEEQS